MRIACGKAMPRYRSRGFLVRAGSWEDQGVGCPRGTFAWGGGASNRGPYNTMNLSESYPVRGRHLTGAGHPPGGVRHPDRKGTAFR